MTFMAPEDKVTERFIVQRRRNDGADWQYVDEYDDEETAKVVRDDWTGVGVGVACVVFERKVVAIERHEVP